jgi:hypothetical protein
MRDATLTSISSCWTAGQTDWPSGETGHVGKGSRQRRLRGIRKPAPGRQERGGGVMAGPHASLSPSDVAAGL